MTSTNGNGKVGKAAALAVRGAQLSPVEASTIREAAAEILAPFSATDADRLALTRLATAALRISDQPAITALDDAAAAISPAERRVVTAALRLATFGPSAPPPPPPDPALELKLAEAAAVAEAMRLLAQQARDQRILAVVALERAKNAAEAEPLAAALRTAEEQDLAAEDGWRRAGRVVQRLQKQVTARRHAAASNE